MRESRADNSFQVRTAKKVVYILLLDSETTRCEKRDARQHSTRTEERRRHCAGPMAERDIGFQIALDEARKGFAEGGVPIGACLVAMDGRVLGKGRNTRIQEGKVCVHVCKPSPDSS
jgi:hypothetical protein